MKVSEVMTKGAEGLQASDNVVHASNLMREMNVGAIPVFQDSGVEGVVTDRDIVVRCIGQNLNPLHTSVGEIMSKDAKTCSQDADINEAARIMENYKIRRLVVTDAEGVVSGMVSLGDLAVKGGKQLSAEVLDIISEPAAPSK
ncbi:MAG: CBS domain-containing protein [Chitinispirillaceae bacterium]